jgi:type I restriction enzyme, S subunit
MTISSIAELVCPVERANPARLSTKIFNYIDIASIDRETKNVTQPSRVDALSAPSRARQLLKTNDVLVSTVRPNLNAVAIVPSHLNGAIGSTGFCVLRADTTRLLPDYLFYYSQSAAFVSHLTRIANGASYPAVSEDDVLENTIPVPPIAEQDRTVRVLKNADRLRRMRRYAVQMCSELRRSTFRHFCEREAALKGNFDFEGCDFITVQKDKELRKGKLLRGDVVLTTRGTLGNNALYDVSIGYENVRINSGMVILRTKRDKLLPEYLLAVLNSDEFARQVSALTSGSAQQQLPISVLSTITVDLPPVALQQELVGLDKMSHQYHVIHTEALRQADHLFQTLLNQAFSLQ